MLYFSILSPNWIQVILAEDDVIADMDTDIGGFGPAKMEQ